MPSGKKFQKKADMIIVDLGGSNSLLNNIVAQIRDRKIQKDSMRFRRNLQRLGEIFAYEISKTLDYSVKEVQTPLGIANVSTFDNKVVAATLLRAGLPLHEGVLSFFDGAESAFVVTFRKYGSAGKFHVHADYCTCPDLSGKTLIIADTMAATGASIIAAYNRLLEDGGEPACTHLVCPITSSYAVDAPKKGLPDNVTLWTAAIDEELTGHSYVIPGLGDAGDLAYGEKR